MSIKSNRWLMLLTRTFPGGQVRATRGETELNDVWKIELAKQLRTLCIMDSQANKEFLISVPYQTDELVEITIPSRESVCEETTIRAVLVQPRSRRWLLETLC
jgi:hypothetical protein